MAQAELLPEVTKFLETGPKMIIGGKPVDSKSGETFEVIDPASGKVLTEVPRGGMPDVDAAVAAAREAVGGQALGRAPAREEGRGPLQARRAHQAEHRELAQIESLDSGKPIKMARARCGRPASVFRYYSGWPTKVFGETNPTTETCSSTRCASRWACAGAIIPWNFPLVMAAWKVAPALAFGNTVVLKPAEQTPLTAIRLAELCLEAGVPEGVVNVVTGFGDEAGQALAEHEDVDKVAFTGSTEVGRKILHASEGNLKRVSLELGGKSPNIVFPDANLKRASKGSMTGVFVN